MKNIFFVSLMIGIICVLPSCNKTCKGESEYIPDASQLTKYSFKPGSYWVYQDSISGIIDSQSVYNYITQSNVIIGYNWGSNGAQDCPVSTDAFTMSVASFWNGILHDTLLFNNNNHNSDPEDVSISQSNPQYGYGYGIDYSSGYPIDTLVNFIVAGQIYPKVYLSLPPLGYYYPPTYNYPLIYHVDNVGIIKAVFNDSINGQHTWNLLRYHVINP